MQIAQEQRTSWPLVPTTFSVVWSVATVVLALVGFFMFSQPAAAARGHGWSAFDLPKLRQITVHASSGAAYRIVVATPAGPAPKRGYPVIYIVDGNAWTALISEIIRSNIDVGVQSRVEPAVVVGIGYPTSKAFDLTRRKVDFTPPVPPGDPDPLIGTGPNGGDRAFMTFIEGRVKPLLEARFPIDRHRQTLIGHSLGGLFTLDYMLDRPGAFQTYVALSPSIWWNHDELLRKAEQVVSTATRPAASPRVFLSVGSLEQRPPPAYVKRNRDVARAASDADRQAETEADQNLAENEAKNMVDNVRALSKLLEKHGLPVREVEFASEDHFSVVPAALGKAVPFIFEDDLARP